MGSTLFNLPADRQVGCSFGPDNYKIPGRGAIGEMFGDKQPEETRISMKNYFDLDADEKRLEWVLLILFFPFTVIIAIGVYSQLHGMNYDRFLIPAFFLICGILFAFYGRNGLKKGNLIAKWTPFYLYGLLKFLLAKTGSMKAERAAKVAKIILGILGLLIAIVCFCFTILVIVKE